mmetsp:Transcript_6170/g.10573  ORF Transcript_6170/g.10573 Transcript_6170/m.10573 type:complete len:103 (-) Transcript_6170:100-408(-)
MRLDPIVLGVCADPCPIHYSSQLNYTRKALRKLKTQPVAAQHWPFFVRAFRVFPSKYACAQRLKTHPLMDWYSLGRIYDAGMCRIYWPRVSALGQKPERGKE